jgi:hypothetical protein
MTKGFSLIASRLVAAAASAFLLCSIALAQAPEGPQTSAPPQANPAPQQKQGPPKQQAPPPEAGVTIAVEVPVVTLDVIAATQHGVDHLEEHVLEKIGVFLIDARRHEYLPGAFAAVLIRALAPTVGVAVMRRRRGLENERLLCAGPGRLCEALGISGADNGRALDAAPFAIYARTEPIEIAAGPRIGITKAVALPWRYGLKGSRFLSKPFRA